MTLCSSLPIFQTTLPGLTWKEFICVDLATGGLIILIITWRVMEMTSIRSGQSVWWPLVNIVGLTKFCVEWKYYTGCFIIFSVITYIYNKKTKGPTLIGLLSATGKLKNFFLQLKMLDVCTTDNTSNISSCKRSFFQFPCGCEQFH
jgi:hypothetical protein